MLTMNVHSVTADYRCMEHGAYARASSVGLSYSMGSNAHI